MFAYVVQNHPASNLQAEEHPSPETGPPSLSSHSSLTVIIPSPQTSVHMSGVVTDPPVQENPGIGPEQSAKHPKLSNLFPSSQPSVNFLFPSPQTAIQVVKSFGKAG